MTTNQRHQLAPQMIDYDSMGSVWVPYVMQIDSPNMLLPSTSTNEYGLRNSVDQSGKKFNVGDLPLDEGLNTGVVLGGSTVFGVGATDDSFTISSWLNKAGGVQWLNFGGRAINSTQELVKFQLHLPHRLSQLVVCSGVNNLTLGYLGRDASPIYNSLFSKSSLERASINQSAARVGVRKAASLLLDEIAFKYFPKTGVSRESKMIDGYSDIMACFERDLRGLKTLADGFGANITFLLQPLATWIDRELSVEEEIIFAELDKISPEWRFLSKYIETMKEQYFEDIERICNNLGVNFYNLNLAEEFSSNNWFFVDRVHLTDLGYEKISEIIQSELSL